MRSARHPSGPRSPTPSASGAPPAGSLLTPELLDGLGGLDLVARTIVRGFLGGLHRSPFLGSGDDFSRHRAYQQGDDVRRLDWRLYGRTDRLFVRLYREESNLQSFVVVDRSESMGFAGGESVTKLRYAQFVAAALSHLMLRSGDAVGLASFGPATTVHLPPRNRPGQLHDLLLDLERLEPAGTVAAAEALDVVGAVLNRKGRVILVSDILDEDDGVGLLSAVGRLRARGDEVIVVRPMTRIELGLGEAGPALYYDPESPEASIPAVPGEDPGFSGRVAAYYDRLRQGLEERRAEYLPMRIDEPIVPALGSWLTGRTRAEVTGSGGRSG